MRGQMWVFDFSVGFLVICFVLVMYILAWNELVLRWSINNEHNIMKTSAYFAAESLLTTPGEPESWETMGYIDGNISAIGLVNGRNELNTLKLDILVAENLSKYDDIKARLGLQKYEFGLRVVDFSKDTVYYEFGKFSNGDLNNSISFERMAILNGEPVIVEMEVWGG